MQQLRRVAKRSRADPGSSTSAWISATATTRTESRKLSASLNPPHCILLSSAGHSRNRLRRARQQQACNRRHQRCDGSLKTGKDMVLDRIHRRNCLRLRLVRPNDLRHTRKNALMQKRQFAIGIALGMLTFAALMVSTPDRAGSTLPPCPFHALTGLYCPGCGTTRALAAFSHGDFFAALAWNPLLLLIVPSMLVFQWSDLPVRRWLGWGLLGAIVAFGIARNLPWEPFSSLAPGGLLHTLTS